MHMNFSCTSSGVLTYATFTAFLHFCKVSGLAALAQIPPVICTGIIQVCLCGSPYGIGTQT